MDSGKIRRVDDDGGNDRLSDLPDCLLLDILSRVGSRLAVQTCSLSRRWRNLWREVPCANVDEHDFSAVSSSNHGGLYDQWARFEDFADQVLSPSSPLYPYRHLDTFRLHIATRAHTTMDRWVRRGLARSPAAVAIHAPDLSIQWIPTPSPSSPQSFFLSRLTKLLLVGVSIPSPLSSPGHPLLGCPALEYLHMERCGSRYAFRAMGSPILRRLAFVFPISGNIVAADLIRAVPRLEYLQLDLICGEHMRAGDPAPEHQAPPLPSISEASIRITNWDNDLWLNKRERKRNKLEFFGAMRRLLARLPNAVCLDLSGFTATGLLEEESQEFPTLNQLKTLLLDDCEVGVSFHALTSVLRNTPDLETLRLHQCKFLGSTPKRRRTPSKRRGSRTTALHQCKNLKLIEIKSLQDDAPQILRLLSEVSKEMPLAKWRRVNQASDAAGLTTMQFHRMQKGAKLV